MLKLKEGCKTCELVKNNHKLLERIYKTSYFIPSSSDSLKAIARELKGVVSYQGLLNHVKKHQRLNADDFNERMLQDAVKRAEKNAIIERFSTKSVQNAVINAGMEKLENGEMKVTATHLLKAAKDKYDVEAKTRDQSLKLAEMIAFFASGEDRSEKVYKKERVVIDAYDPSIPVTEDFTRRED